MTLPRPLGYQVLNRVRWIPVSNGGRDLWGGRMRVAGACCSPRQLHPEVLFRDGRRSRASRHQTKIALETFLIGSPPVPQGSSFQHSPTPPHQEYSVGFSHIPRFRNASLSFIRCSLFRYYTVSLIESFALHFNDRVILLIRYSIPGSFNAQHRLRPPLPDKFNIQILNSVQ